MTSRSLRPSGQSPKPPTPQRSFDLADAVFLATAASRPDAEIRPDPPSRV
ncbi:unnamed protein product [Ixodes pacificus]